MTTNFELVGVEAVIQGVAAFTRDANNVNSLLAKLNTTTHGLGKESELSWEAVEQASNKAIGALTAGVLTATTALAGLVAGTIAVAASFQDNLLRSSVIIGATEEQTKSLGRTIETVASNSRIGLNDIVKAQNELARSGTSVESIEGGALKATVALSEASGGELGLAASARLVAIGMQAWGLSVKDVDRITASFTATANASAIGFNDLNNAFQLTAPLAAQLGIPIEDLAATIGVLGQAGLRGEVAGTALKTMLLRLFDPSKKALAEMKQFNVSLQDVHGNILPLPQLIEHLAGAFGKEAVASGKVTQAEVERASAILFGTRSSLAAISLTNAGTESFEKLRDAIRGTDVYAIARAMQQTLNPQLDILKNNALILTERFGTPLTEVLAKAVQQVNIFLRSIDPKIPTLFGDALLAAFSGQGITKIGKELEETFGGGLGNVFAKLLEVAGALHEFIFNKLVPAFVLLGRALFSNLDGGKALTDSLDGIIKVIEELGSAIANRIGIVAQFIGNLKQGAHVADIFNIAIQAISALPLVAVFTVIGRLAIGFVGIAAQIAIVSGAFIILRDLVTKFATDSAGAIKSVTDTLANLSPVIQLVISLVTILSGVLALTFIKGALSGVVLAVQIFNLEILETVAALVSVIPVLSLIAVGFVVFQAATGHLQEFIDKINQLPPEFPKIIFGVSALILAIGTRFAAVALVSAVKAIGAFIAEIAIMITSITVAVASYAVLIAQVAVFTAVLIFNTVSAVGQQIIALGALIARVVLVGSIYAFTAASMIVSSIATAISINGVALASAFLTAVVTTSIAVFGAAEVVTFALGAAYTLLSGAVVIAGTAVLQFVAASIARMIISTASAIPSLAQLGASFILLGQTILTTTIPAIIAFATTIVSSILAAVGAALVAIAPFILGLAAISAVVVGLYLAFQSNFLGIRDIVNSVVNFVIEQLHQFFKTLDAIPIVHQALGDLTKGFNDFRAVAVPAFNAATAAGADFIDKMLHGLPLVDQEIAKTAEEMNALVNEKAQLANLQSDADSELNNEFKRRQGVIGGTPDTPFRQGPLGFPPADPGRGGSNDKTRELVNLFEKLLAVLPGDTHALAEFLAKLETEDPGRLKSMVSTLLKTKDLLEQIAAVNGHILAIEQVQSTLQKEINQINAANAVLDLQRQQAELSYTTQIAQINARRAQIALQLLPIQQQIASIDREIAALQRTDYDLELKRLNIQQQMLPIQQQMAALDRQINIAQREDFNNTLATAKLNVDAVPLRQKIADIETQINRVVDQRGLLLRRNQEIQQQRAVDSLTSQLNGTQRNLDAAWKVLNVPQILALEAQKESLTNSLTTAQDQLTATQDQQKAQAQLDEVAQNNLKLQEIDLQNILNTYEDQITVLKNQKEIYDANQAVIIASLQLQKSKLQEILDPLEKQLIDIDNLKAAHDIANAIIINGLEQQKQKLLDLAQPLQDEIDKLDAVKAAAQAQIDVITTGYDLEKVKSDAKLIQDQLENASLDALKLSEQARFDALTLDYINAITSSQAFTVQEAAEVLKRLGYTNSEIENLAKLVSSFGDVQKAAQAVSDVIRDIQRDVTVTVHIVTVGTIPTGGQQPPSFKYGGVVPGAYGTPQLIIAHGGEKFLGMGDRVPLFAQAAAQRGVSVEHQTTIQHNYEINPTYTQTQSPASIALDLRALAAMSKR